MSTDVLTLEEPMQVEVTVLIEAPADVVWSVMSDVARWPSWTSSVTSADPLQEGPLREGAQVRVKQPGFPAAVWQVTQLSVGEGFTWENRSPGLHSTGDHRITSVPGGTQVRLAIRQEGPLSAVARAFGRRTRRYVHLEAEGLRRRSEEVAQR